ncbi:hypothetical protein CPLU01_08138 [Colletotrichum plurivorum]|uniref:Uncharacterized protein n=1 Tax=Colletotrichum plurivorum TaxID=2175906 RepID=A0A8H6KDK3_9PEZI|nr:hypothetical protein CPLU01_08138 [Colletotrichum plurivorum]
MAEYVYLDEHIVGFPAPQPCIYGGHRERGRDYHNCCPLCCSRELADETYKMTFAIHPRHLPVAHGGEGNHPFWTA